MPVSDAIRDRENYILGRMDGENGNGYEIGRSIWYLIGWDVGDIKRKLIVTDLKRSKPDARETIQRAEDV